MSACVNKIPAKHDPLPAVPAGWGAWECVTDLQGYQNAPWTRLQDDGSWHTSTAFNPQMHIGIVRDSICIRAVKLPAKKPKAKKGPKLPDGCPPIPRGWVFKGFEWDSKTPVRYACWKPGQLDWGSLVIPAQITGPGMGYYYITKPKAKKPTARKEPRVSRIATVIMRAKTGEFATAFDAAREVERIIDNHQRAKRRKEGK